MKGNYRENVAAIIINKEKKVLMCEHIWIDDAWQFPQGGVEKGEDYDKAILREIEEEINLTSVKIIDKMEEKIKYEFPFYLKEKYKFNGQIQTFYLIYFYGDDSEFKFDNYIKPEFKAFEWVELSEPALRVIYFKKISYFKALEYFKEKIENLDISKIEIEDKKK